VSFPTFSSIEIPILQELAAVGGSDDLRFLYQRLIAYFPQLSQKEISEIKTGINKNWRSAVQRAGKSLDEQNLITRQRGIWTITKIGEDLAADHSSGFTLTKTECENIPHIKVQLMLVSIGKNLCYDAEEEFEYYDVVWRTSSNTLRLSHIFEVQSKGNIDSAFAKLKRGYEAQRSKPFLIISTERDLNRAKKSLSREFEDLAGIVTILTFQQITKVYQNINNIKEMLNLFLEKQ
jgi:hypothetical protein